MIWAYGSYSNPISVKWSQSASDVCTGVWLAISSACCRTGLPATPHGLLDTVGRSCALLHCVTKTMRMVFGPRLVVLWLGSRHLQGWVAVIQDEVTKAKEKKEILQSPVQMLRNVYHKPNPDVLTDEQVLSLISYLSSFEFHHHAKCPYPCTSLMITFSKGLRRDSEAEWWLLTSDWVTICLTHTLATSCQIASMSEKHSWNPASTTLLQPPASRYLRTRSCLRWQHSAAEMQWLWLGFKLLSSRTQALWTFFYYINIYMTL